MTKIYRLGAVGALLDEYERAILDLQKIIEDISDIELTIVVDTKTTDLNCKSIQAILSHVVSSAYGYAISIQKLKGYNINRPDKTFHSTIKKYRQDLTEAFEFTTRVFKDIRDNELEQFDNSKKLLTAWGQVYDIEQMTEHAIVHILRHRRQIEKFKIALRELK
jgi:uncharacterized damage-inducible protein DinB